MWLLSAQRECSPFSSDGEHPANCSHPVKSSHAQKVSESRARKNSFCSGEPAAAFQREGISPGAQELASVGKLFSEFTSSVLLLRAACTCSSWYYAWISLFPQGLALNKWGANMGGYRSSSLAAPPPVGQFQGLSKVPRKDQTKRPLGRPNVMPLFRLLHSLFSRLAIFQQNLIGWGELLLK